MPQSATSSVRRCAIYTRKSTNKLLDSEVNSLTTQREISSAYIKSQQYKGWVELDTHYDDGGHSGSGLERPAMAALMKDIEANKIDVVVIYKIDRLTRSLLDFVRLMEIFDRRSISLVSISQAFDTSDSMGRMILNILLTFSQFERELIGERVRDSIRTRKRHGKVHGGLSPFGYVSTEDGLEIDAHEAEIVEFIFEEFIKTRRYTAVMTAVREAGMCSSVKPLKSGKLRGGTRLSPGTVYNILKNPIYIGEIPGHNETYKGLHQPIVSRELWKSAQELVRLRKKRPPDSKGTKHFLAGLLWDDFGRQMWLRVKVQGKRGYAYYASSNSTWSQRAYVRAYRAKAEAVDQTVRAALSEFLCDRRRVRRALRPIIADDSDLNRLAALGVAASARLDRIPDEEMKRPFHALLSRVEVGEETISIKLRTIEMRRFLEWDDQSEFQGREADWSLTDGTYEIEVAVRVIAAERWPSLHIEPHTLSEELTPDPKLVDLITSAREAQSLVDTHRDHTIEQLAKMLGCRPTFFGRLIRINYLAPDIVTAILDGRQPAGMTRRKVLQSNVPTDWAVQRKLFGIKVPERSIAPSTVFGREPYQKKQHYDFPETS